MGLVLVSGLKLLCEIALMALLGQAVLRVLAGDARQHNVFYRLLAVLTRPVLGSAGRLLPRGWSQGRVAVCAFVVLLLAWTGLTTLKVMQCLSVGMAMCR